MFYEVKLNRKFGDFERNMGGGKRKIPFFLFVKSTGLCQASSNQTLLVGHAK
jgi:hypothetical protein